MASRFPTTVKRNTGALSASQRRMSTSTTSFGNAGNSVVRSSSSGLIRRHSINTPEPSASRSESTLRRELIHTRTVGDWPEDSIPSGYCHLCGDELKESGKGLSFCAGCHSLRLKSGHMSHAYAEKHPTRTASKDGNRTKDLFAVEPGTMMNGVAARGAGRRMSMREDGVMADDVMADEGPKKIMAGFIDTGYKVGDRIKSRYRPAVAAASEAGWNPLNKETDEGVVLGPGHKVGEILVKFEYGEVTASMKLHQIEHAAAKPPASNLERNVNRRQSSKGICRASTLESRS
mmetsp:Transcript_124600/g.232965  ORF Transcript_124600/g.232965 Transcript_124600/m.232965 type:complete len:290 (-) Transcript_124600:100-969(-)